ncbi:Uncharacterised protein [Mycobacteroides abscessus subsp. abscessus]|nr:Uncharacterised protein [Mycobacteroides abscessus subsp. abscessus]
MIFTSCAGSPSPAPRAPGLMPFLAILARVSIPVLSIVPKTVYCGGSFESL